MIHEVVCYTPKELHAFFQCIQTELQEYVWEWILRVWGKGRRNIKLDQAEFIDMGQLNRNSEFNVSA